MSNTSRPTLDHRLMQLVGRTPLCILAAIVVTIVLEVLLHLLPYYESWENVFDQLDTALIYINFPAVIFFAAWGGAIVGAVIGGFTGQITSALQRLGYGLMLGVIARLLGELLIQLVKEKSFSYAFYFVKFSWVDLLITGLIAGAIAALAPPISPIAKVSATNKPTP
jgi:hypothetical protein